ncbi:hypothetical protein SBADM41S_04361 [Streptomyces badius]
MWPAPNFWVRSRTTAPPWTASRDDRTAHITGGVRQVSQVPRRGPGLLPKQGSSAPAARTVSPRPMKSGGAPAAGRLVALAALWCALVDVRESVRHPGRGRIPVPARATVSL